MRLVLNTKLLTRRESLKKGERIFVFMKTKHDHITDDQIDLAFDHVTDREQYHNLTKDLDRIANLAWNMARWQCWFGAPLTYFQASGLDFDGQHRCRAVKFLARRKRLQIQVPLRYSTEIEE